MEPHERAYRRGNDPGGYPCMPYAVSSLDRYQRRHKKLDYHRMVGSMMQAYMNWRAAWVVECLRYAPHWYRDHRFTRATIDQLESDHAPPLPGL